ncbi:hypothetical protein EJ110_NYTH09640 [Nymphaea thermarum]|nr:hypothetical protein EJ110_NYTH09640 [Nymphaea thermarum]
MVRAGAEGGGLPGPWPGCIYGAELKGFATRLTENGAELLRRLPAVLSVLPKTVFQLQTTRTPLFLGLNPATVLTPVAGLSPRNRGVRVVWNTVSGSTERTAGKRRRSSASFSVNQSGTAAYKVCGIGGCFSSDILVAMVMAIRDGVDILTLSPDGPTSQFYVDEMAIDVFAAMQHGILVSCSSGNTGPSLTLHCH